jgi:hypothetical protein
MQMNDIIAWLAHNNTLLIRIGFTAVILLLVVYVFRLFFLPRVTEVLPVTSDSNSGESSKGEVPKTDEEVLQLKAEISTLKFKLKEAEVEKNGMSVAQNQGKVSDVLQSENENLEKNQTEENQTEENRDVDSEEEKSTETDTNKADVQAEQNRATQIKPSQSPSSDGELNSTSADDAEKNKKLNDKIRSLEARLAEYEIIAEDIAEIGVYRAENVELKNKLNELQTQISGAKVESAGQSSELTDAENVNDNLAVEVESSDDNQNEFSAHEEVAEVNQSDLQQTNANNEESIILKSDAVVSAEEQALVNEFENFKNTTKG